MSDFTLDPSSPPPILTNLPSAQSAFTKKYANSDFQTYLAQLSAPVRDSFVNYDIQRVQKGQAPLSPAQSLAALQSVVTKTPATPPESQSFFNRTLSDLSTVVSEIPHLPFTLFNEATQLPDAPAKLSEVLSRGGMDAIAGLTEVPGLRLIPGVFTASQVAKQGLGGALEHPLFTALDVLPYAKPGVNALTEASFSKLPSVVAARTPEAALDFAAHNAVRDTLGLQPLPEPSALRIAGQESSVLSGIRSSRPYTAASTAFGSMARDTVQLYQSTINDILKKGNPDLEVPASALTPETAQLRNALIDSRDWSSQIPLPRMQELSNRLSLNRTEVFNDPLLTDTERAFATGYADHVDEMAQLGLQRGFHAQVDGEIFMPGEGARILNSRRQVGKFEILNNVRNQVASPSLPNPIAEARAAELYAAEAGVWGEGPERLAATRAVAYAEQLPAPDPGMVRLYRGEASHEGSSLVAGEEGQQGQWFHPNPSRAADFGFSSGYGHSVRTNPQLLYVDVPQAVFDATRGTRVEHLLPAEYVDRARPIEPNRPVTVDLAAVRSPHLTVADREKLLRGYAAAYDAAGFDATNLKAVLNNQRGPNWKAVGHGPAIAELQNLVANPQPRPILTQADLIDAIQPFVGTVGKGDPSAGIIVNAIKRGDYATAAERFNSVFMSRTKHIMPGADDVLDSLRRQRDTSKYLNSTSIYSDRVVAQLRKSNNALESRIIPARFQPIVEAQFKDHLHNVYSTDPNALNLIDAGFYSALPNTSVADLAKAKLEIARTWRDLRDQGYDPVFIHSVSPSKLDGLTRPNISDSIRTPTQVRQRTLDATPAIHDATVGLTDQAMEYLSYIGQQEFTKALTDLHGISHDDLLSRYMDAAMEAAKTDTRFDAMGHAELMLKKDWEAFDPSKLFPESKVKLTGLGADDTYLPKSVTDTLKQLFHDRQYKLTSAITDPIMKVFRTSILPLRVGWHVGNIGGGATILAMNTSPLDIIRYWGQARELIKSGDFHELPGMPPAGLGSQPADIIAWNKQASFGDKVVAAYHHAGGETLRKLWDSSQTARDYASKGVDASYRFNSFFDDTYRAIAYISGHDKALVKGLTERQAEQAGVSLVRKILPEWDRMTPFERTVVRSIFPFYSWAGFILKHAYRYPIDHPYRAAVTASLGRLQKDDMGESLPTRFMDSIFLGNADAKGNVSSLQTGTINPFRDVANYFTLAGFTRSVNPVLSTILEAVGVNPAQGVQDLYPDIAYDPATGQLRPSNPNLLSSFIGNVVPQSQLLTAMLGRNEQFKQILRTNPEAAAAMLRSSVGLPNLFRTVNPSVETFKAETQRSTLESQVKADALKTGDWSRAQNFPNLRAYFQQVAQLMGSNPAIFKQYVPTTPTPSTSDALKQALVGLSTP